MIDEAAAIAPETTLPQSDAKVPSRTTWERAERWMLAGLFVFGLVLPIIGAFLGAIMT